MGGEQEGDPCPDYGRDSDGDFKKCNRGTFRSLCGIRRPEHRLPGDDHEHGGGRGAFRTASSLRGGPSSFGTRGAGERYAVCFRLQRGYSGKKLAAAGPDSSGGEGAQGRADGFFGHGYEDYADVGAGPFKAYGGRRFPPGCLPGSPPGTDAGGIHAAGAILRFPPRTSGPLRGTGDERCGAHGRESDASGHGGRPGSSHRKRPGGLYGGISERGNRLYGRRGAAVVCICRLRSVP